MVAFHGKTISFLMDQHATSYSVSKSEDCEENDTDSEKSDEKDELDKKELSEFIIESNHARLLPSFQLSIKEQASILMASADYSLGVYSPPEQFLL